MPKKSPVVQIAETAKKMGDHLDTKFYETEDLKVAHAGLTAYKTCLSAAKTILQYKKLTGKPMSIPLID